MLRADGYDEIDLKKENIEIDIRTHINVNCPKCGAEYTEYDIEFEKMYRINCEECGYQYCFMHCPY